MREKERERELIYQNAAETGAKDARGKREGGEDVKICNA